MKKLLLALLMVGPTLTSAYGQARPAITQDRDQEGRNAYSETSSCNTVTFSYCSVVFSAVPAGKRRIVTYVSMLDLMPAANTITSIDLRVNNGNILAFLKPQLNPGPSPTFNYVVSDPIFATFNAGDQPQLLTFINGSANFQMVGIISGYYVDIP